MHTTRNLFSYLDDVMNVRGEATAFTFRKVYFLSASEQLFFYLQIRVAFTPHQRSFPSRRWSVLQKVTSGQKAEKK